MSDERELEGLSHAELLEKYEMERRLMSDMEVIAFTQYFIHVLLCAITSAADSEECQRVIEENWPEGLSMIHLPFLMDAMRSEDFLLELIDK